ncbi:sensor histidine kinase [Desulforhopalus sp. 52FAK]
MQIAATLAILLSLAILLGNVVVVAFWQKGVVRSEIDYAQTVWASTVATNSDAQNSTQSSFARELELLCRYAGSRCAGVVTSGGEHWFKNDIPKLQVKSLNLAQESALSQKEIITLENNMWGIFSLKKRYLLIAKPLRPKSSKEMKSAVLVIALDSIYDSIFKNHKAIFVYWLVNVLLLSVVGFFRLINITVKPVERMVRMSESYHDSDALFSDGLQKRSELGQLSMALSGMLCRIASDREKLRKTVSSLEAANSQLVKNQKEMVRTEKIASVGILSAGLAHEIGNPIGIVQGYVELLQQPDLAEDDKQQFAERSLSELDRINKLIRQLLDYAGSSSNEMSLVNLDVLCENICQIVALKRYDPPISLKKDIPVSLYVMCDDESLRQVFLNCLLNAFDAIEAKGGDFERQVMFTAEKIAETDGGQFSVRIRIEDNGTGIAEKDLEVIFDPFFTTKDPGKGTGLGLFVSQSIIDAHGGKIWVETYLGSGSTVHVELPAYIFEGQEERDETADH